MTVKAKPNLSFISVGEEMDSSKNFGCGSKGGGEEWLSTI